MAMSINTNMGSLRAQQAAANVSNDMQQAMNRLSLVNGSILHLMMQPVVQLHHV